MVQTNVTLEQRLNEAESVSSALVYVMGYGRSGSTLLDILLSNHHEVVSVGALANLPTYQRKRLPCACGSTLEQCDLWSKILRRYSEFSGCEDLQELGSLQLRVETLRSYLRLAGGKIPVHMQNRYGELNETLFTEIRAVSECRVVVDSSKSALLATGRVLSLARLTNLNVRAIFLVRDGRGVVWSALRGPGSPERVHRRLPRFLRVLKTAASWSLTNALCILTARLLPEGSTVMVRYEDLVTDPARELDRIGSVVPVDMGPLKAKVRDGARLSVGHNIGGNRLRFEGRVGIKPDFEWQSKLPLWCRALYWLVGWPTALALGYRPRRIVAVSEAGCPT